MYHSSVEMELHVSCVRLVLFLTVGIAALAAASVAQHTVYIVPNDGTPCPSNSTVCLSLSQYAQNPAEYSASRSVVVFLPGDHTLSAVVTIANATSLTMQGSAFPSILCTPPAGFTFENISRLQILNLAFVSCGKPGTVSVPNALLINSVESFEITNCLLEGNVHTAILLYFSTATVEGCTFKNNGARVIGGAFVAHTSKVNFRLNNTFINNSATSGGGIYGLESTIHFSGSSYFSGNLAFDGGGIAVLCSEVTFTGDAMFTDNTAKLFGGGMSAGDSNITFRNDNVNFVTNTAGTVGGGIYAHYRVTIEIGLFSNFTNNTAGLHGGGLQVTESTVNIIGSTYFYENYAGFPSQILTGAGAGLHAIESTVLISGNALFINNSAGLGGGIIVSKTVMKFNGNIGFVGNFAPIQGSAISIVRASVVNFIGDTTIANNNARVGAGIYIYQSNVTFTGTTNFSNNTGYELAAAINIFQASVNITGNSSFIGNAASNGHGSIVVFSSSLYIFGTCVFMYNLGNIGGAVYAQESVLKFDGNFTFMSNSGGIQGGAMSTLKSDLTFTGNGNFLHNSALRGGGLFLEVLSKMHFLEPLRLYFEKNTADQGGAIFVADVASSLQCSQSELILDSESDLTECFFQLVNSQTQDIQLVFRANFASERGSILFGGMLDRCRFGDDLESQYSNAWELFRALSDPDLSLDENITLLVSSDPYGICFCSNGTQNCDYHPPVLSKRRGETFIFSIVAVDQLSSSVPTVGRSFLSSGAKTNARLGPGEAFQEIQANCTDLSYTILSPASYEQLILYADGPCQDIGTTPSSIDVILLPCPDGFQLSESECICEERLQIFTNSCSINQQTFRRESDFWVGMLYDNGSYVGLILHPHCPFDYCQSEADDISFSDPDTQCAFSHSGLLCGGCQESLSLTLGSSSCRQCSNAWLALLVLFALAGVVLVVFLLALRLTVADGTLGGLIFYANIVAVNKAIIFPAGTTNILTVFIAWLNLDLGIETCFYNGMDAYAKTWLQFVFPFYLWTLVFVIIWVSQHSFILSRLLGTNPVSVLATLFLLSYKKLLRTIIATLSFTFLDYPDGSVVAVWLYDGNIQYLSGKHIPLFLVALTVLLFLFFPYTMLLILGQWLQAWSNRKPFSWFNDYRIKAFMDAYHAPYEDKYRSWTGLLLLFRCALFLVFAFNALGSPSVNLLAITSATLGFAILTRLTSQIYKQLWQEILESSFFLNLGILAAALYHVSLAGGSQAAVADISASIALITFIGILLYHIYLQVHNAKLWEYVPKLHSLISHLRNYFRQGSMHPNQGNGSQGRERESDQNPPGRPVSPIVITMDMLREPLLESL